MDKQLADVSKQLNDLKAAEAKAQKQSSENASAKAQIKLLEEQAKAQARIQAEQAKAAQQQAKLQKELANAEKASNTAATAAVKTQTEEIKKKLAYLKLEAEQQRQVQRERKNAESTDRTYLSNLTSAYNRLKTAQNEHLSATKDGSEERQKYWQDEIEKAEALVKHEEELARANVVYDSSIDKINQKHSDAAAQTQKYNEKLEDLANGTGKASNEMGRLVQQAERWIATMVVMRGLRNIWNGMTDYAAKYYDAMNEIRVVTMMSEADAEALGASYRQ